VVDVDVEKFFDRVNHDLLMEKLSQKIEDGRALQLIRRYLEAGMMAEGLVSPRSEGTPQGGSLSSHPGSVQAISASHLQPSSAGLCKAEDLR